MYQTNHREMDERLKALEKLWSVPTYEDFKEKVRNRTGEYPRGIEMLEYMHRHPDQAKLYFPHPAKIVYPDQPGKGRKGVKA
jgi:hypothetical protein